MVDIGVRAAAAAGAGTRRPWWARGSRNQLAVAAVAAVAALLNLAALERGQAGVEVLVAARDLTPGRLLEAADVGPASVRVDERTRRWLVPVGGLDGEALLVRHGLRAGEPLRWSDVRRPPMPGGHRAMSVPVEAAHAVGGRVRPGEVVDIAAVRGGAAAWVLTGVEVLAVDDDDGLVVLTLAVDADGALRLALALRDGEIDVVRAGGARPAREPRS